MNEVWKDIEGYEGFYQVSNLGRVKSLPRYFNRNGVNVRVRERLLKSGSNRGGGVGYLFVCLMKNSIRKEFYIHRLVAAAFIPNPSNLPVINHINGDIHDNMVSNLEWCTQRYNVTYRDAHILRGQHLSKRIIAIAPDGVSIIEFDSSKDAAKHFGIWTDTIYRYLSGKFKNSQGYEFRYK